MGATSAEMVPPEAEADASPSAGAPQIQVILPESEPEEISPPQADEPSQDRLTRLPRHLASQRRSWIFSPPPVRDITVRR